MQLLKHALWDTINVKWLGTTLNMKSKRIDLPGNVNIPLWDKVKVRALLAHENVKYNIMIRQGNTWYTPRNDIRNTKPIQQEKVYYFLSYFRIFYSMARHSDQSFGYEALKSPPSIYGAKVSAELKRTYKGEVIMTVRIPSDTVDSEVYIKTPRGHSGIQINP